jgi:DNA-binding FadR family transcriptional regulator
MPKRVSGDIEMALSQRIEAGEWSQSLRLPNERHLADEYGVARNTIRAAMERIHADGGVRREVGRGTFLQRSPDADLAAVTRTLIGVSPADTMVVRRIIEPKTAALAATKNLADLNAIAAAHDRLWGRRSSFRRPMRRSNRSSSPRVTTAHGPSYGLRVLRNQEQWVQIKRRSFGLGSGEYCDEHAAIVQALMRRDSTPLKERCLRI